MKKIVVMGFMIAAVTIILVSSAFTHKPVFELKQKLSAYNFFAGPLAELKPADGIVPYELNTALFSNYAEKLRFVKLPQGMKVNFTAAGALDFPVGTVFIKNFYYPNDFRQPEKGRKILETRLLVHEETGWNAYPYVWNKEQTEAMYDVAGSIQDISYINKDGKRVKLAYIIPNKNQCKGCHIRDDKMVPIGPTAMQLNRDYLYTSGNENQLQFWQQHKILEGLPEMSTVKKMPVWNDAAQPLNARARAYLDVNCGNCHHPQGPANTSGLFLNFDQAQSVELGIMKSPVAAGRGAGKNSFDIVPGKPNESILTFRMQTNDPGIAMPELGREQVHTEGVELIREWISKMKN
ncbi:MAG: SO2930 family diheme c-type cytochrome [Ferruginibacter sp.]